MAHTNETPESRTLLLRRIAQLEDDLAETRGCIVRLASVIETLLIDGPQPAIEEPDIRDTDWLAPVIPLEPGRTRREDEPPGQERASRPLPPARSSGGPAHAPSNWGRYTPHPERSTAHTIPSAVT
jgi:hypothetical protein